MDYKQMNYFKKTTLAAYFIFLTLFSFNAFAQGTKPVPIINKDPEKLVIVWTSGDREIAMNMVLMFAKNSYDFGLWTDIEVIIWGPSAKLAASDEEIQTQIKKMIKSGVKFKACQVCADNYGVAKDLSNLGIKVTWMSQVLTQHIARGNYILTF